jgi:hypothetical protein
MFVPRTRNVLRPKQMWDRYFLRRVTFSKPNTANADLTKVPMEFHRHAKVFSKLQSQQLPEHTVWDYAIELLPDAPRSLAGWLLPLPQNKLQELREFMVDHLQRGTIWPGDRPYAANIFYIKKKDGKLHLVQDYCPLSKHTRQNWNISLLIPQTIDQLAGCTLFTKFDIRWGYNNIWIKKGDEWKAAFLTPEGLFKLLVMFFGLTNLPATFQMMMNSIFWVEVAQGWLLVYMDDIAIHTQLLPKETEVKQTEWHKRVIHQVLDKLETNDLYLKPKKCEFLKREIDYLGVIVGNNALKMDPKKLQGVADWKTPQTPTDIQKFLGFTGYYRFFIPNYSKIARPLLELTKKATPQHWGKKQAAAFNEQKDRMYVALVLMQPNFEHKFYLQVDASAYSMGAILS